MDTVALLLRVRFFGVRIQKWICDISDHMDPSRPKKTEDPKKDHLPRRQHVFVVLVNVGTYAQKT